MKIKLEYNNLTVTIQVLDDHPTSKADAIVIASAILQKTQDLDYGSPQLAIQDSKVSTA